jgi:hypothetical protein
VGELGGYNDKEPDGGCVGDLGGFMDMKSKEVAALLDENACEDV